MKFDRKQAGEQALELFREWQYAHDAGELYDRCIDPEYWLALCPNLSIGTKATLEECNTISAEHSSAFVDSFKKEGYLQTDVIVPASLSTRMREGVATLRQKLWHPVFAFVYDEFWLVPRLPSLVRLIGMVIGRNPIQTPYFWVHYVSGDDGSSGWPPHMDHDNATGRMTVWIALTDATLDNGCIYLLPKHLLSDGMQDYWYEKQSFKRSEVVQLLHACRALPVQCGSILAWDANTIHWGAPRVRQGAPRISFSVEFNRATEARNSEGCLPVPGQIPDFQQRLRMIGHSILLYMKNEPLVMRYAALAERLAV